MLGNEVERDLLQRSEDFRRAAVEQAHPNALRIALLQATGDATLANMKLGRRPIWGGTYSELFLSDADLASLRDKACAFLRTPSRNPDDSPGDANLRNLMDVFCDDVVDDFTFQMGKEELGFEQFPRGVDWPRAPERSKRNAFPVLVVGAGAAGLSAAVQLKRLEIPFIIIERNSDVGGTWLTNNYPGLRVDTASYNYQLSFMGGYSWKHYFALQPELLDYFDTVADRFNLRGHIRFQTEVKNAEWDDDAATWRVTVRDTNGRSETLDARAIISAAGLFNRPNKPEIQGFETFRGKVINSAEWDHSYDWSNKRIALIGVGSTGAQLMPVLAKRAASLTVFQRSPQWVGRRDGYRDAISDELRWLFRAMPNYRNWYCFALFSAFFDVNGLQNFDREWQATGGMVSQRNDALRAELTDYIHTKIGGRTDLLAKLVPDFPPLAKRLIADNGWYDALLQPNVELVTDHIKCVNPQGIVTTDGIEREFDLIVLCSGFETERYLWPAQYTGRDGLTLEQAWSIDGARAYLGMTVPGFPNLFMIYGPNGQARAGGVMAWLEISARYAVDAIAMMIDQDIDFIDCRQQVFDDYNARMDRALDDCIWSAPIAKSYYVNKYGRQNTNMPWLPSDYYRWTRKPVFTDYEIGQRRKSIT
jgi:4-hydroxyacetophenone monooxygenase